MFKRVLISLLTMSALCVSVYAVASISKTTIAPSGIHPLEDGGFLIADNLNRGIWQMDEAENITHLAGNSDVISPVSGLPVGGSKDGAADVATFNTPWDITDFIGGYAITDSENHVVRFYNPETSTVATVSGEKEGYKEGIAQTAMFSRPTGIVTLEDGSILVADTGNHVIRKIATDGYTSLYAGTPELSGDTLGSVDSTLFNEPTGLYYSEDVLYVADTGNHRILKIEDGLVSLVAGITATEGYLDGEATQSAFSWPINLVEHEGVLYVADYGNGAIRAIEEGQVTTFVETGSIEDGQAPISPKGLAVIDEKLWIGEEFSKDLYWVDIK